MTSRPSQSTDRPGVPFHRLVRSEIRKVRTARATLVMLCLLAIGPAVIVTTMCVTAPAQGRDINTYVEGSTYLLSLLLPIQSALIVTTEWGQRTIGTTFLCEPRRTRVMLAKAVVATGTVVTGLALALTLAGCAAQASGGSSATRPDFSFVAGHCAEAALGAAEGFALALLLRKTSAAVCGYLFIPFLFTLLTGVLHLSQIGVWINPLLTQEPLPSGSLSALQWARLAVAEAVWIGLPATVGLVLLRRREVSP